MTPIPATVSVPLKLTRWAEAPMPAVCKQQEGCDLKKALHAVLSHSVFTASAVPLVMKRPCSQSHEACTRVPPSCQRSLGGTWRGSSSALWSLWPQWWGTRPEPEWSDGGREDTSESYSKGSLLLISHLLKHALCVNTECNSKAL